MRLSEATFFSLAQSLPVTSIWRLTLPFFWNVTRRRSCDSRNMIPVNGRTEMCWMYPSTVLLSESTSANTCWVTIMSIRPSLKVFSLSRLRVDFPQECRCLALSQDSGINYVFVHPSQGRIIYVWNSCTLGLSNCFLSPVTPNWQLLLLPWKNNKYLLNNIQIQLS